MANSDPDVSTPDLLQQAMQGFQMYEQGRYDEARVIFQELLALDPAEGYYRTALGATCLAVDELDESLVHFNEAIRLNDADTAALINRGEVHLRLGNNSRSTRLTCCRVRSGIFFSPLLLHRQQERSRQQAQHHVVMPPSPPPHLILIQPYLALLNLELGLDRPAPGTHPR